MTDQGYVGMFPWMAEWWKHNDVAETIVVRCHCGKRVGEVKCSDTGHPRDDGPVTLLRAITVVGNAAVPTEPGIGATPEDALADWALQDSETLRYLDNGMRVQKRKRVEDAVGPIELTPLCCPEHGWLEGYEDDLAAFARDTERGSRRKFIVARDPTR